MKHTDITRDAVAGLPHATLTDLVMDLAATADRTVDAYAGVVLADEARDQRGITPGAILDVIETAVSDHRSDPDAVAGLKRKRARNAAYWNDVLPELLDDRLDDGTLVIALVIAQNPDLARRLRKALS